MWEYLLLTGPLAFLAVVFVLEKITPNYDRKNNYVSELALGKHGRVQKINLVVYGFWLMALSIALANKSGVWGWNFGVVAGLATVVAGVWDTDAKGHPRTLTGDIHNWAYRVGTLATGSVFLSVGWELRNNFILSFFSWSVALFNLCWWVFHTKFGVKDGVAQRVVVYLSIFWLIVVGLWTMWR